MEFRWMLSNFDNHIENGVTEIRLLIDARRFMTYTHS